MWLLWLWLLPVCWLAVVPVLRKWWGVHVGYYYKDFLGNAKPIQDADKYAEVVSVVKGSKVKKSDLKNLQAACNGSTAYSAKDVPDEIDVDWETATAKVILSL